MLKIFFVKNYVRPYDATASVTMWNAFLSRDIFDIELFTAIHAVVSEHRSVKLDNTLASCLLVEIIDILCDYCLKLALSLKSYESLVSLVRSCIRIDKLTLVKIEKVFRMLHEEIVSNDVYRSVLSTAFRIIDTGTASEVGNAALCGYTCSAKENNIFGFCDQLLELIDLVFADAAESVNSRFQNNTSINEHLLFRRRRGQHLQDHRDRGTFRLRRTFPYR